MIEGDRPSRARRRLLAMLAALPCVPALASPAVPVIGTAGVVSSAHGPSRRIVVLDWDLTEIVLSLGVVPVGVARPSWYARTDGVPPLPAEVVDTGLLFQPNFEVLARIAPDLIVITPWHAMLRPMLERIAPTLTIGLFEPDADVWTSLRIQTRRLGAALDRATEADALLRRADASIAAHAAALHANATAVRPVYLIQPLDATHVNVFGPRGLFGCVLRELGIANAWRDPTDLRGVAETDLAALARDADAQAVLIGPPPPGIGDTLAHSPLWRALPFVDPARIHQIERLSATGGLVTAMRFATQIAGVLGAQAS
ncbi:iron-siderophore ABC transporter substrate-binding protein [Pararobbsia silviterrae]|uniref:Iron-siderophore ABC transporter substrate-binding protein n=2 Tax=Pararobbsia silviterrae TaxID=1792498 RepID=A0A494XQ83_9BURK|nr:iron-siderophore ABC transporter substrate-binding protein [Pararobbsia silviterrae]